MKICIEKAFAGFAIITLVIFVSSCTMVPKRHIGEKVVAGERIELETTREKKTWSTDQLTIEYNLLEREDTFDLSGFVLVSTSVTYTFPSAEYLYIYVYQLDSDGVATSRHTLRPNISAFNTFTDEAEFSATLPKDRKTTFIAFGYLGNFFSIEREEIRRMGGYEKLEWEIYHDPFR